MIRLWNIGILAGTLLVGSAFADFIQSPIPASSRENYLYDADGDGRLDRMSIKFLGTVSRDYLNQMVDSLTFDWRDSSGLIKTYSVTARNLILDSTTNRRVTVDLSSLAKGFDVLTSKGNVAGESLGNVKLYLSEGSVFDVAVFDRMAPVVREAFLKSYRGKGPDTLTVDFSEKVNAVPGCQTILEFRKSDGLKSLYWNTSNAVWNGTRLSATFIAETSDESSDWILPRDSVRFTPRCVMDSSRNFSDGNTHFRQIDGFYPLEVLKSNMVVESAVPSETTAIFQLIFGDVGEELPNIHEWGVAMDVLGPEFENVVRYALGMNQKKVLDLKKLKINYNLRIYTNLGAFVVGTSGGVYGNDPRFSGTTRLFLKWNLMDGTHKRVATGAYISNASIIVSYDGQIVFRNDIHHGPTTQVFGVKRK